jgi:hypothetical protein
MGGSDKMKTRNSERVRTLKRIFKAIENRVVKGEPVRRLIRRAAKRLAKGDNKSLTWSASRLAALFYAWRRNGDSALGVHYHPHPSKVSSGLLSTFVRACQAPEVFSMVAAHKRVAVPLSVHGFYRALSVSQRKAIKAYHASALEANRARRALQTIFHLSE